MTAAPSPPAPPAQPVASALAISISTYSYAAQTEHGFRIDGRIEAPDQTSAVHILEGMRLRVIEVSAVSAGRPKVSPIDAFTAFNQRLAQLTSKGLPVEEGLRLIAVDMRRGRLSAAVAKIADDLRDGVPLAAALEKHGRLFPPLYVRLVEAGAAGGDLPSVLLNLGRHLETQERLRAALWKSVSYPLATFCGLLLITSCIGWGIMPQLQAMFVGFRLEIPAMLRCVIWFGRMAPYLSISFGIALALILIFWLGAGVLFPRTMAGERFLPPIPLIGPVLRFNLISRWLDAVRMAGAAGLDFPAAVRLAGDSMRSAALTRDGARLTQAIASGMPAFDISFQLLPVTISMAIEAAIRRGDLPAALETLCDLYRRQTELRLERIPAILSPLLIILIAIVICFVIGGVVLPLFFLIQSLCRF